MDMDIRNCSSSRNFILLFKMSTYHLTSTARSHFPLYQFRDILNIFSSKNTLLSKVLSESQCTQGLRGPKHTSSGAVLHSILSLERGQCPLTFILFSRPRAFVFLTSTQFSPSCCLAARWVEFCANETG